MVGRSWEPRLNFFPTSTKTRLIYRLWPNGGRRPPPSPPSPLRNHFAMDTGTGIDLNASDDGSDDEHDNDDDDPTKWHRSPSPASFISHLATSFVSGIAAKVTCDARRCRTGSGSGARTRSESTRCGGYFNERGTVEESCRRMRPRHDGIGQVIVSTAFSLTDTTTPWPSDSQKESGIW